VFPHASSGLNAKSLSDYIREFNKAHRAKLHLWGRTHGAVVPGEPIIVRFTIPDILIAYLTLVSQSSLLTESVTTFGPRERVGASHRVCIRREM